MFNIDKKILNIEYWILIKKKFKLIFKKIDSYWFKKYIERNRKITHTGRINLWKQQPHVHLCSIQVEQLIFITAALSVL